MYDGIENIIHLLNANRLKEALVQLEALGSQANDWELRNRIETLHTSYGYMLQYARQGVSDPKRKEMYLNMLRSAYELTEWANVVLLTPQTKSIYFEHRRTYSQHPAPSYSELLLKLEAYTEDIGTVSFLYTNERQETETSKIYQRHETALNELFNKTWTSLHWNELEVQEAQCILDSVLVTANDKAVFISAVMMSLTHLFDERKIHFLVKAYFHEDKQISQRALIGLVIISEKYKERIKLYPNLISQITLMTDQPHFATDLFTLQMQLFMTLETDKITKKMNEEIIPGIMKASQIKKGKIYFDEMKDEDDINPEWEEQMEKSGISEKIREMGEMQIAGGDVYMSTFSMLKNYPFFNQVSHWFYPFDMNHNDLISLTKEFNQTSYSPLSLILYSDTFCNSDKYSFCLTIYQMPQAVKEQTLHQFTAQAEMHKEQKDLILEMKEHSLSAKSMGRQYLQDLYRFSKIWTSKHPNQEKGFFQKPYHLWSNELWAAVLGQNEYLKEMADFLFQSKHHEEAKNLYIQLLQNGVVHVDIHQKIGYILQKQGKYKDAIRHYEHADILSHNNPWTLKHIAQCYKGMKMTDKALEYYQTLENISPDDLSITQQIGECWVRLKKFEAALPYFYKVEYLEKNPINARRAIAWCSLCLGKQEEAIKYYHLLLQEEQPSQQDWLNMGHVYLIGKNTPKAMECYNKAQDLCKDHSAFIELFNEDEELLQTYGIPQEDIRIILDLLV